MIRCLTIAVILALPSCRESKQQVGTHLVSGESTQMADDYRTLEPTPIVIVSDEDPDPYDHPTTHPESLYDELGLEGVHGDGSTSVNFVGKVVNVTTDGKVQPISGVKFFRFDDNLGSVGVDKEELSFTTDANGNFNALLEIFAASARRKGGGPHEMLIYQTGTAFIDAVADGFETRRVNVRFEQPSTLLILERSKP